VRMLVFQRDERAQARRRWPDVLAEPHEEYYTAAEPRSTDAVATERRLIFSVLGGAAGVWESPIT
jgi:hypothetical protein